VFLVAAAGLVIAGVGWWRTAPVAPQAPGARPEPAAAATAVEVLEPDATAYARYAGSESCRECHRAAYDLWAASNHAAAERPVVPRLDAVAFVPPRQFRHGTQTTTVGSAPGDYAISTPGWEDPVGPYRVERVIGRDPLRQFLVAGGGGRWQTLEASYDPRSNAWFNVYGAEDRQLGEWGHWTGRGMNWNSMCAGCHNTRLRRGYDAAGDRYATVMAEMGVGCEACHGPLAAHGEWRRLHPDPKEKDPTLRPFTRRENLGVCGGCHARRYDLTGDAVPPDDFADHFSLVVVDGGDTYHADGQVRDEDYEYAAFLGSRMNRGGVWCKDCHDPHSAKTLLPGNWLCLRCHNGGMTNAPIIEPVAHSFHKVFGYTTNGVPVEVDLMDYRPGQFPETGGECVNCHMPQTVYMQRHWRHDHGFTIPDPGLTKHHGVPNACNRCHADKDVDWALAAVERWYGARMDRPSRHRAQAVAAARRGQAAARDPLLGMLVGDDLPYWRAVAAGLLEPWAGDPAVARALRTALGHPEPLVREKAARALDPLAAAGDSETLAALGGRLGDPSRSVRVAAAWSLRTRVDPASPAGRDLQLALDVNADQPAGQLQKGVWELARQRPDRALDHLTRAVGWDPNSAPLRHELAVVLSQSGRPRDAVRELEAACRIEPREAEYAFKLGLAWAEAGDASRALAALEQAVRLNPAHGRAWYNLGLARNEAGQTGEAIEALVRAESIAPMDPQIPYARATILARTGRAPEARQAARRALEIQPRYAPARELIEALR
jgi:tetratricopeptide (TPR) repeat protein